MLPFSKKKEKQRPTNYPKWQSCHYSPVYITQSITWAGSLGALSLWIGSADSWNSCQWTCECAECARHGMDYLYPAAVRFVTCECADLMSSSVSSCCNFVSAVQQAHGERKWATTSKSMENIWNLDLLYTSLCPLHQSNYQSRGSPWLSSELTEKVKSHWWVWCHGESSALRF